MVDEDFERFVSQASEAASVMKSLGHEGRLRLLCYLAEAGEISAGELTARVGLSQSALSQHLAKLRAEGLVATRKQSQSVFYRIAEPKALDLLHALHRIYCPTLSVNNSREPSND
ncbi:MAG: ArsR/SmtB family transcription factor [Allosphingosinicella sp.]